MPKIPNDNPQISLSTPGLQSPSPREFGKVGAALENVGATGADAAINIDVQMRRAEAQDASSSAYASDKIWANQKITELKLQSPDGYMHDESGAIVKDSDNNPRTIAHEFYDQANQRFQDNQQAMPSLLAAQMYKSQALQHFSDQTTEVQNQALIKKVGAYDQNALARAKALGADVPSTPIFKGGTASDGAPLWSPVLKSDGSPVLDSLGNPVQRIQTVADASAFYGNLQDITRENQNNIGIMHDATAAQAKQLQLQHILTEETGRNIYSALKYGKKTNDSDQYDKVMAAFHLFNGDDPQSLERKKAGLPTFSDTMDGDKREIEKAKILSLLPQAKASDYSSFLTRVEETIQAQKNGEGDKNVFQALLNENAIYGLSDPEKHGAKSSEIAGRLFAAQIQGVRSGSAYLAASNSQRQAWAATDAESAKSAVKNWADAMHLPYTADMGARAASAIRSEFVDAQAQVRDERKNDLVEFSQKVRDDLGGDSVLGTGARAAQIDYTSLNGIDRNGNAGAYKAFSQDYKSHAAHSWSDHPEDYRAPISKVQAETVAAQLQDNGKSEQLRGQAVAALTRLWGKDYSENVNQMYKDGKLPGQYKALMALHAHDNTDSQTFMMSVLSGQKAEETAFRDTLVASGKLKESDARTAVMKYTDKFINYELAGDMNSNQRVEMTNGLREAVYTGMLKEMKRLNTTDTDVAAKSAYDRLIGNFINPGTAKNGTPLPVPKFFGGKQIGEEQANTIRANLTSDAQHLEQFNPATPTHNGKPDLQADKYLPMINRDAIPVKSPDGLGHNFVYDDATGVRRTVMTRNANGKPVPVFVPLEDSLKSRPQEPGFFERMLGGATKLFHPGGDMIQQPASSPVHPTPRGAPAKEHSWNNDGHLGGEGDWTAGPGPNSERVVKGGSHLHSNEIMAYRVMGSKPIQDADMPKFKELSESIKNYTEVPKWLTPEQKKMVQQFRDHSR